MAANNDSADLEARFESISSDYAPPVVEPAPVASPVAAASSTSDSADSDDLQALFDSISAQSAAAPSVVESIASEAPQGAGEDWPKQQEAVFNRIGHMALSLHDTLRELGYEKLVEQTVSALPDAKDRLAYVANLTEQAACRVLNATYIACPLVDEMASASKALGERWDKLFANELSVEEFKQLANETRSFLKEGLPQKAAATHS